MCLSSPVTLYNIIFSTVLAFVKECKILCFVGLPATFLVVGCFYLDVIQCCAFYSSINNHSSIIQLTPCTPLLVYLQFFGIFTYSRSVKSNFDPQNYSRSAHFLQYLTAVCLSLTWTIFIVLFAVTGFTLRCKCRSFIFKFWLLMITFQRNPSQTCKIEPTLFNWGSEYKNQYNHT